MARAPVATADVVLPLEVRLEGREAWRNMGRVRHALVGVKRAVAEDRVGLVAAGVAFYCLLALFPALAAAVSIYGLVSDPGAVQEQVQRATFVPREVRSLVATQLGALSEQPRGSLGIALGVSILFALWGATKGARALIQALNIAHGVREDRGFVRLTLTALALTFGGILLALAGGAAIGAVPVVVRSLGLGDTARVWIVVATWIVLALCAGFALALGYRFAPAEHAGRRRGTSRGALVAAPLWIAASLLFSFYVSRFGKYQETYGSLGAIVIVLLWLWISAYVVVLGAELDVELDRARRSPDADPRHTPMRGRPGSPARA